MSELGERFLEVAGVVESDSMFGDGPAYWVNGKEVAHVEPDGSVEIRLTRAVIREHRAALKADPRVDLRRSGSDWIEFRLDAADDLNEAVRLLELAAAAHRPPPGVTAKPPPTGADLERRRRFH